MKSPSLMILFLIGFMFDNSYRQTPTKFTLVIKNTAEVQKAIYIGEAFYFNEYKAATFDNDSAVCENNQYIFKGEILYPTAIRIYDIGKSSSMSKLIFIDSGYQELEIVKYNSKPIVMPVIVSKTEMEHHRYLVQANIVDIDKKFPSGFLNQYIRSNPKSYVALFSIINQAFNYDFSLDLKTTSSYFDSSIKMTKGFRYFSKQYLEIRKISNVKLKDLHNQEVVIDLIKPANSFTFIDFWFTGCVWCVPNLKQLKKQLTKRPIPNIKFLSVCTDAKGVTPQALALLNKYKFPWKNYWDAAAVEFSKYTPLYKYPSNILVDNNGYIIAKDIEISKLSQFASVTNNH